MTTQTTQTAQTQPSSVQHHGRRDLRTVVGMTVASLALLGSIALWQLRPGDEATQATTAPPRTSSQGIVVEQSATLVPVPDAEMYHQWQAQATAARLPVESNAVSDQEMFSQWQQRSAANAER
jgi:hypothetical protein